MKARCAKCGCTLIPSGSYESESDITCPDCGALLDPKEHQGCKYGEIHVTAENESFVVEWQL